MVLGYFIITIGIRRAGGEAARPDTIIE